MTTTTVYERVRQVIVDQLGVNPDEVTREAHFVNDLGADSLDTVELIMALEDAFEIEIPDDDAEQLQTVGQVVAYIESHLP